MENWQQRTARPEVTGSQASPSAVSSPTRVKEELEQRACSRVPQAHFSYAVETCQRTGPRLGLISCSPPCEASLRRRAPWERRGSHSTFPKAKY